MASDTVAVFGELLLLVQNALSAEKVWMIAKAELPLPTKFLVDTIGLLGQRLPELLTSVPFQSGIDNLAD